MAAGHLLPLVLGGAIALVAPAYANGGTHVVGVDPDRAAVWSRRGHFIGEPQAFQRTAA
jgi:hypothetical protein